MALLKNKPDGHIIRFDLLGKDAIVIKEENKLLHSRVIPWSVKTSYFGFDEYDAGRPDVMFKDYWNPMVS